jgi:hypothetical protein
MGLKIILRNENGVVLDSITDSKKLLHRLLPQFDEVEYPYLRFIDRYGDTIFNGLQMSLFLDEWSRIIKKANGEEEKKIVLYINELALRCQQGVHLYLVFYGD